MINKVRWRRPHAAFNAIRKMSAHAAAFAYRRVRRGPVHGPVQDAHPQRGLPAHVHAAAIPTVSVAPPPAGVAQPAKPVIVAPGHFAARRWSAWRIIKWIFWLSLITVLVVGGMWGWHEMRHAERQAEFFHRLAAKASFKLGDGPSKAIRFPQESPYDERLGYANMPQFLQRLQNKDYQIVQQSRMTPEMVNLIDRGLFPPYAEKTQVGLAISDCRNDTLFRARFPERIFPGFDDVPPLLVNSLLFIENRELLDPAYPKRNPAVEWDRLSKAVFDQAVSSVLGEHKAGGGSTLATQIEKYRHSPDGRTGSMQEKLRQMLSASFRAYQDSEDTMAARKRIVLDYLNTVPLSAKPGFGEVNGIGDGLWVWYGREFSSLKQLLLQIPSGAAHGSNRQRTQGLITEAGTASDLHAAVAEGNAGSSNGSSIGNDAALAYKQALSLMIAQRRPSWYLVDPDNDLEALTNLH